MSSPGLAAVILAGGASKRMGRPKALLPFRAETILDRLIGLYRGFCDPVIVVLGHAPGTIREGIARAGEVSFVVNPDPGRGQLSSLQRGLSALSGESMFLFQPVDYAAVSEETIAQLLAAMKVASPLLAIPRYNGKRGHPVACAATLRAEFLALPPTGAARDIVHAHRVETQYVDVDDLEILRDIDSPEDYRRLVVELEAAR